MTDTTTTDVAAERWAKNLVRNAADWFGRDPDTLLAACPECPSGPGVQCVFGSGGTRKSSHASRTVAAPFVREFMETCAAVRAAFFRWAGDDVTETTARGFVLTMRATGGGSPDPRPVVSLSAPHPCGRHRVTFRRVWVPTGAVLTLTRRQRRACVECEWEIKP